MKLSKNRSLGIDISDQWIRMMEIGDKGNGAEIIAQAQCEIPEGVIEDGNIIDAAALSKTIKTLKNKNKLNGNTIHVSLLANPVLCQILDLPKVVPHNIGNYIHDEIKNYAKMPSGQATIDYCGLKSMDKNSPRRSLVYAADASGVDSLLVHLDRSGIKVNTVEPCELSLARAYFANTGINNPQRVILVVFRHDQLRICVFKGNNLELIRVKSVTAESACSEVEKVLNYYEFESGSLDEKIELKISSDTKDVLDQEQISSLTEKYSWVEISIEKDSRPAHGLALAGFNPVGFKFNINLMPEHLSRSRENSKKVMISANLAAFILLFMIIAAGSMAHLSKCVANDVTTHKKIIEGNRISSLIEEEHKLADEITAINNDVNSINDITGKTAYIKWSPVIAQMVKSVPKGAQLAGFYNDDSYEIMLNGIAVSHDIVLEFAKNLKSKKNIASAEIISTQKQSRSTLVDYSIKCSIKQEGDI